MLDQVVFGVALWDGLLALLTAAAAILIAVIVRFPLKGAVGRLTGRTSTSLDDAIVAAVSKPLMAAILVTGLYLASKFLPLLPSVRAYTGPGFSVILSLLGIYAALSVVRGVLAWYGGEMASKTEIGLDDKLARLLKATAPIVAGLMALLVVLAEIGVGLSPVTSWLSGHGTRLGLIVALWTAAIFALDWAVPKLVRQIVSRGAEEPDSETQKRADTLTRVLVTVGQITIISVASFMVLSELGLNIGPVLAGLGVAGLAFGFGSQYLIRDLIAGLFIIMENQYRVGDVARVAGIAGLVEDINLRRTLLRDLDGIVHVVPNGEIRVASNLTRGFSRVNLNISVAYDTDLEHAMAVIDRVGKELARDPQWAPHILTPPQSLRVDSLGDSGIEIKILGDPQPIQPWGIMGELRKRIKKAFDDEGIEIPWPHTKVFFGNQPPAPTPTNE
ncbi:MAG: mechanosensitive ion channel family protein [Dehalococcoidia bacterium]|nr:mechanosensitive ion channel family protein [Dehalococcoidia bacterium]